MEHFVLHVLADASGVKCSHGMATSWDQFFAVLQWEASPCLVVYLSIVHQKRSHSLVVVSTVD